MKMCWNFFLVSSACLILFISCFSCFTAYNANKWIAENYRYAGYKVIAPNTLVRSLLKKDWGLTDEINKKKKKEKKIKKQMKRKKRKKKKKKI